MPAPPLVWSNRQRAVSARQLSLPSARALVEAAWPLVRGAERRGSVLGGLEEIGLVLVSDHRIAALHGEFMGDPAPTDVITFLHGEIVVSAETARREARRRNLRVPDEIARYAVHGLLHLAGWKDAGEGAAAEMCDVQEKILRRASACLC
ncbi:MAG: rRNA maturation RNase YbeY [Chthoniobacterales bacterium]|nr:rRNA maturation RNase YbeY [Chthoniobacterales bacterium]